MTFSHNTQKIIFKTGFFCVFWWGVIFGPQEARKREKPYCVNPKLFFNLMKYPNFKTLPTKMADPSNQRSHHCNIKNAWKICFNHSEVLKTMQTCFGYKINSAPWWPKKSVTLQPCSICQMPTEPNLSQIPQKRRKLFLVRTNEPGPRATLYTIYEVRYTLVAYTCGGQIA